jgi:hypothetical protein
MIALIATLPAIKIPHQSSLIERGCKYRQWQEANPALLPVRLQAAMECNQ